MADPRETTPENIDAFVYPCVFDFYCKKNLFFLLRWQSLYPSMDVQFCVWEQLYCSVVVIFPNTTLFSCIQFVYWDLETILPEVLICPPHFVYYCSVYSFDINFIT